MWVAHVVLPDIAYRSEGRRNDFREDSLVKTGSSTQADYFIVEEKDGQKKYTGWGYDRGHLAPSADFRWSKKALSESFYYSNMSAQVASLNRESWANLEDAVRYYVTKNNIPVFVVTGFVLSDDLPVIDQSPNKVSIPRWYYKVILDTMYWRGIGFVMENKKNEYPLISYAVTIDSVERLTGLNFFPNLNKEIQDTLEARVDVHRWVGEREQDDVPPVRPEELPRNTFNTVQARNYINKGETIRVLGTLVSTKLSSKGNIFIYLDKKFPNQIFSITIFSQYTTNFSYNPEKELLRKKVVVWGKIKDFRGVPSLEIQHEEDIQILSD